MTGLYCLALLMQRNAVRQGAASKAAWEAVARASALLLPVQS